MSRFPAIEAERVVLDGVQGKIRPSEKACFMSHRQVLMDYGHGTGPLMILEDDAVFGASSFAFIEGLLSATGVSWDIVFTDICVPEPSMMAELARMRPWVIRHRKLKLLDLKNANFVGATAYIINPLSFEKLKGLLNSQHALNEPYDVYLRRLIHADLLKCYVVFPFLTTLSDLSQESSVQLETVRATDFLWNTYRRMMWIDRNPDSYREDLKRIERDLCDDESLMLAPILCSQASEKFLLK